VQARELTTQGFPFFAGTVKMSQSIDVKKNPETKYILQWSMRAADAKIYVNGKLVTMRMWAPYEADITDCLTTGTNKVSIEMTSGNRNLMGPHHNHLGETHFVGPSTFTAEGGWSDHPHKDIWKDGFSFVPFGLK